MAVKAQAIKFDQVNKAQIKGKVGHTRTGACTCKHTSRCYHGTVHSRMRKGK